MKTTPSSFTRVKNDGYGNPRYVCGYVTFYRATDRDADAETQYSMALKRAKPLGGKRFHNKQFGGGVLFQCFNLQDLCDRINQLNGESNA